jgi:hypothetical protein
MHMVASQVISVADASVSQPLYLVFIKHRIKRNCSSNKVESQSIEMFRRFVLISFPSTRLVLS